MRTKPQPTTSIATSDAQRILIRGHDLVEDLIGQVSFTEMFLLQLTGQRPSAAQVRVLDAVLVTLMEHGITPSVIATRLIYHSAPDALQAAVAAGLLGVGTTFIGTMEGCAANLEEMLAAPEGVEARARAIALRHKEAGKAVHGFGHPHHKPDDPRTPRMLAVAEREGVPGRHLAALRTLSAQVDDVYGRHLTINATGASAALLGEIGIPQKVMRGVAVVSRSAGLVGHIQEEITRPSAVYIWETVDEAIPYR
ncbi:MULTISPECIES: citryl-CoA lyase [Ramlibacter]|uniref:citrate synthase (unknown stereospecificity) n=1 Tax=Ramlibacter pinisoli TaxID=2682844 RepID=A0A6N8IQH6_9BURK|nr:MULTISPECIES: citryl-CoA lyase [Ramlibacter]MBA2963839.1 citryl-CoA lyase [Ramlibacter sp. CGMCC 1.13660]MVQ28805.1 citryl-CoA lyase [Ramlibacter pinisoli]